jgi:XRE family transcriptional regulator, regulator of sulfur utilization
VRYNAQAFEGKSVISINKRIASTLKTLRQENGWSLDRTAQETGVSKAMLGQIERGESSPTIATLWKIATGFHTSFSSFLDTIPVATKKALHRSDNIPHLHPIDKNVRISPLFPYDDQLHCEIFVIELLPSSELISDPHESGVIEHIIVVEGSLEILLKGRWKSLSKGEGLRFHADQPHGYRNTTAKRASFHNVIHYPL